MSREYCIRCDKNTCPQVLDVLVEKGRVWRTGEPLDRKLTTDSQIYFFIWSHTPVEGLGVTFAGTPLADCPVFPTDLYMHLHDMNAVKFTNGGTGIVYGEYIIYIDDKKGCQQIPFKHLRADKIANIYEYGTNKLLWARVDPDELEVDTPLDVLTSEGWVTRHFAGYVDGKVYVWGYGATSYTAKAGSIFDVDQYRIHDTNERTKLEVR